MTLPSTYLQMLSTVSEDGQLTMALHETEVEWFEGDFSSYIEDKKRRLGEDAVEPKRIKFRKFER